ncbi:MAG TPA: isochorismatase family cysteine hydrolase [Thermoanaerobaculales bacterium]|nr:isochorismatase family cysteine hydrolase [Thermoanaerobaculales bacterium]HPA81196.1 isochorismatase family cysteine hydrolase [Thermoanaerobaculales bacterium]HQL29340.1 isochorismatase family cysteine hydrolase [Thermoanaerobaculales bacterium]HQN97594.1 isochorismatase family cysteine hydrolase [Thermoanaerobaculales bacterium]HQP43865.1 isochorismatase family cysteine hydrolase [Thermoanaerobaculales bacterium]
MSPNSAVEPGASAVIVIDFVNDFVYPGGVIADAGGADYQARVQAMLPTLAKLLDAAREAGVTVIHAPDAHTPEDVELRKWPAHAMKGTEKAAIVAAIAPKPGDLVIEKSTYSPFVSTDIDAQLKQRGISRLYIAGLHTDCCARHTSGDAFQRGYELVWISDALQAFTVEAHLQGLEYFKTWYASDAAAQIRTAEEVIADWRGAARHE